MGNSEEKRLPDKGLSDLSFSGYVLTLMRSAIRAGFWEMLSVIPPLKGLNLP